MAKGFSGVPGNLQGLMKQAQKMQAEFQRVQQEAEEITADGSSGGGMVKVVANGKQRVTSISIERDVVNPEDIEMLQDLILAATNEALSKVHEQVQEKMAKVTGGLNIPGLF